jgi:hypothetical protein
VRIPHSISINKKRGTTMLKRLKTVAACAAVVASGLLVIVGIFEMHSIAFADNGIYSFDENAVYLEGLACTVNLEGHITQQYAAEMMETCLVYHEMYLDKVRIIQGL